MLQIDRAGWRAWTDEEPIPLTRLEFRLLRALAESHGRVLTHDFLLAHVWGFRENCEPLCTRRVPAAICSLRRKLGREGRLIRTLVGVGYWMEAD